MNIHVFLCRAFPLIMAVTLGMSSAQARASSGTAPAPTKEQLQQALDRVKPGSPRIHEFLGCVPAMGQPATVRLCMLTAEGRGFVQDLPFRFVGGRWEVVLDQTGAPPEIDGACAPLDIAQDALRKLRGDAKLRVTGEVDDGAGIFTAERGMLRNKKGPYRLMCRYEVAAGSGKKDLVIAYVWHDGTRYVVDSDIEVWPDD
ncbi:hypothetical protein [Rhizobium sp. P44RR-XXIV]|uniref:hypothetical protein n=1 Tax=Rhizobium sp. P44RR-XXIV TaxID=1921145 RepID=UPI0010AAB66C|nr:hypothetical protein [Rhizobium sp. P44RR-XXIV]TIX87784.1 hypothetical protein BSK43_033590 [Rhizobium sp. P44RR-XXIV]